MRIMYYKGPPHDRFIDIEPWRKNIDLLVSFRAQLWILDLSDIADIGIDILRYCVEWGIQAPPFVGTTHGGAVLYIALCTKDCATEYLYRIEYQAIGASLFFIKMCPYMP